MCKCKLKSSPIFSKFTRPVDKIDFAKLFFADSRYKYKLLAFLMILKISTSTNKLKSPFCRFVSITSSTQDPKYWVFTFPIA